MGVFTMHFGLWVCRFFPRAWSSNICLLNPWLVGKLVIQMVFLPNPHGDLCWITCILLRLFVGRRFANVSKRI